MNYKFLLNIFTVSVFCLFGCGNSDDNQSETKAIITLSPTSLSFDNAGGTNTVNLSASQEWSAYTEVSWLKVSPTASIDKETTLTITAEANNDTIPREATLTVKAGTERSYVTVKQAAASKPTEDETITAPEGYHLVWNDEFKGTTLNTNYWTFEVKGAGWMNQELQAYVRDNDVATVKDGFLNITCKKVNGKICSARLYAKEKTGWTKGWFEARIKLPKGKGTWPAFWMMPAGNDYNTNPWPGCGEIDIIEEVGGHANYVSSTIHCNKYNNTGTTIEHHEQYLPTAESDFHVYACEWTDNHLKFYVDGRLSLDYVNDGTGKDAWPFTSPFYVILNLAWGGSWGGMYGVDETALPATMQVDYVRVFQK